MLTFPYRLATTDGTNMSGASPVTIDMDFHTKAGFGSMGAGYLSDHFLLILLQWLYRPLTTTSLGDHFGSKIVFQLLLAETAC
jgi:hypothetical protein